MPAFYPDGSPIPDDALADAQAQGLVRFDAPDAPVTMVTKYGRVVPATASDYAQLAREGARLETAAEAQARADKEKYSAPGEVINTYAEGALKSLPAVGGALYAGALESGFIDREESAKRAAENPNALLAGEITGSLVGGGAIGKGLKAASSLNPITGAAKLAAAVEGGAAKLATKAGLGAIGTKAVGMGAAGAVEAGLYGVNNEIAQAALEDRLTELDGEKLWSAFGHAAVIGGLGGAAIGAAGEVARKGLAKVKDKLNAEADHAVLRSIGLKQTDLKSLLKTKGEAKVARMVERVEKDPLFGKLASVDDQAAFLNSRADEAGAKLDEIREGLELAGAAKITARPDVASISQRIRAEVLEQIPDDAAGAASSALQREVNAKLDSGPRQQIVDTFLEPLEKAHAEGRVVNYSDVHFIRRKLDELSKFDAMNPTKRIAPFRQARAIVEDEYEKAIAAAAKAGDVPETAFAAHREAKAAYEDFISLGEKAQERAFNEAGKQPINLVDKFATIAGAVGHVASGGTSALASIGTGLAVAAGGRLVSRYQNPVVATVARTLAQYAERRTAAVDSIVTGRPWRAAAAGAAMLARDDKPKGRPAKLETRYNAAVGRVLASTTDPGKFAERVSNTVGPIADTSPTAYMGLVRAADRANAYLTRTMPKPVSRVSTSLTPAAETPRVSRVEQRQYLDRVEAVEDPASVVEDLARGKLSLAKIEALRETSPGEYEEIRTEIGTRLAESGDTIPYKRRIMLSLAFDLTADASLRGQDLHEIQASISAPPDESGPGSRGGSAPIGNAGRDMLLPTDSMGGGP